MTPDLTYFHILALPNHNCTLLYNVHDYRFLLPKSSLSNIYAHTMLQRRGKTSPRTPLLHYSTPKVFLWPFLIKDIGYNSTRLGVHTAYQNTRADKR